MPDAAAGLPPASPEGVPGAVLDASSVNAEEIVFESLDRTSIKGYLARPAAPDSHPGMIVIQDAAGVSAHIQDVTRRIAQLGYVALAPDLYTREGGPPPSGDLQAIMARLFSMSDATVLGDLEGAALYLRGRQDTTGKLGCIGFCMGGRCTLLFAGSSEALDVAVDCWGGFVDRATPEALATPERPTPPLELAERVRCPLMAAIGAEDQNPSPEIGARLRAALQQTPGETQVDVYDGAGHAFFADYRPSYRPEAAAQLWERVVPFLNKHLNEG
jgi:carboxymethylenebutenolidase